MMVDGRGDSHALEPDRRKLDALDGLRGLAVLLVMASHFERFIWSNPFTNPIKSLMIYGWVGVDLFFALSGFLITGILLTTRGDPRYYSAFYARRALRIFPIYYGTLAVVFAFALVFPSLSTRVPPIWQWPLYLTYLTNWIPAFTGAWPPNVIGHFWSLALEEQYYLIWPFIVAFVDRRWVFIVAISLASIALLTRIVLVYLHGPSEAIALSTITRCDALAIGSLGAIYYAERQREQTLGLGWIAGAALLLFGIVSIALPSDRYRDAFSQTAGLTLLAIGFAALVAHLAFTDHARTIGQNIFRRPFLRKIGRYSYGMYVYHVPILGIFEIFLFRRLPEALRESVPFTLSYVIVLAVATYLTAAISYEFFESQILAYKRFFRSA